MKRSFPERVAFGRKIGLSAADAGILAQLYTPQRAQDFISTLPINIEKKGQDTCRSVAQVLKHRRAHCIEAAFVAAAALWMAGHKPLLMDMQAKGDQDHVIVLFKEKGYWGAVSKSNHVWLRWRDPVYKNLRELAMSYFHEYTNKCKKTLRNYSVPFDLRRFDVREWVTNKDDCWDVAAALDDARHYPLITPAQAKVLRPRDALEMRANKLLQFRNK